MSHKYTIGDRVSFHSDIISNKIVWGTIYGKDSYCGRPRYHVYRDDGMIGGAPNSGWFLLEKSIIASITTHSSQIPADVDIIPLTKNYTFTNNKAVTRKTPDLSDWKTWRNSTLQSGECVCGIIKKNCDYHR